MLAGTVADWERACAEVGTDKTRFMPFYHRHFGHYADRPLTLMEIGVLDGGSLRLWRRLFPQAELHALDIDPRCAAFAGETGARITIGSQADARVLEDWFRSAAAPPDVLLDDGSHRMDHIVLSFRTLFPLMKPGSTYVVEDIGTSYMPDHGGASVAERRRSPGLFRRRKPAPLNAMDYFRSLADEVNTDSGLGNPLRIRGLIFHDNVCLIEKG